MATLLLILVLALLSLAGLYALARVVDRDGYGTRPAPRSHEGWGVTLPSVSPASVNR